MFCSLLKVPHPLTRNHKNEQLFYRNQTNMTPISDSVKLHSHKMGEEKPAAAAKYRQRQISHVSYLAAYQAFHTEERFLISHKNTFKCQLKPIYQ